MVLKKLIKVTLCYLPLIINGSDNNQKNRNTLSLSYPYISQAISPNTQYIPTSSYTILTQPGQGALVGPCTPNQLCVITHKDAASDENIPQTFVCNLGYNSNFSDLLATIKESFGNYNPENIKATLYTAYDFLYTKGMISDTRNNCIISRLIAYECRSQQEELAYNKSLIQKILGPLPSEHITLTFMPQYFAFLLQFYPKDAETFTYTGEPDKPLIKYPFAKDYCYIRINPETHTPEIHAVCPIGEKYFGNWLDKSIEERCMELYKKIDSLNEKVDNASIEYGKTKMRYISIEDKL